MKNQYLAFASVVVMLILAVSLPVHACQDGYFRDFVGPTKVRLNNTYTYSVFSEGEFKYVKFSATGGQVVNTWNEQNKFFAEVQWTQNDPNDPTKLKVYGEDGCNNMQDLRYFMEVNESRSPNDDSNNNSGSSNGAVRFFDQPSGRGNSFFAKRDMPKLASKWNDRVRSVWIGGGVTVILYEHANYKGDSIELTGEGKGTMFNLSDVGFERIMSSFEID